MNHRENPFYQLAENSPDAIFIATHGCFAYMNPAALRLFGAMSMDQLLGQPILERIHPDDRTIVAERIKRSHEHAENSPLLEETYLRLDGTPVEVEVSAVPFRFNGEDGSLVFVRNITQRKFAERALGQNQDLLHSIIDNSTAVIFVKDLDGRYLRVNRRFSDLFHVSNEAMLGRTDYDLVPAAVAGAVRAADQQVLAAGTPIEFEEVVPQEDGPHTYISLKFPLRGTGGQPYAVCCIATDITDRKRAEEEVRALNQHLELRVDVRTKELRATEEQLRETLALNENILMASPISILAYRQDGQCAMANPAAAKLVGGTLQQLLAQNFRHIVSWRVSGLLDAAERVLAGGAAEEFEARFTSSFGCNVWVHSQLSRFTLQGKPHLLLLSRDITEKRMAEQALQEADQRKNEFIAMLAHELRNPMAPIRNAAHILGQPDLEESRIKWAQATIEGQVAHLTRLVDDLLDVSRIVQGKITLKQEEVEFADLAERVLDAARPLMESKGHRLIVHVPAEPAYLDVDPVRITQVLLNLLDNAAKYNPDGGRIEFDARVEEQEIEIQIRDNGMGIPADLLPHVFEAFQQGERTLDRSQGGLGIGLTLAQKLVEMHGGRVKAHSDGAGQGATFTVRLPVRPAPLSSSPENIPATSHPPQGIRILVVDDEPAVADSTAVLLEMEGHEVRVVHRGYDALELIPAFQPQVVLLDIGLKGMDGFETAKRLRKLPAGQDLYLVAVTGYGDAETKAHALAAGCDHFLTKPMEWKTLSQLLADV